jgi:hypothetical protein
MNLPRLVILFNVLLSRICTCERTDPLSGGVCYSADRAYNYCGRHVDLDFSVWNWSNCALLGLDGIQRNGKCVAGAFQGGIKCFFFCKASRNSWARALLSIRLVFWVCLDFSSAGKAMPDVPRFLQPSYLLRSGCTMAVGVLRNPQAVSLFFHQQYHTRFFQILETKWSTDEHVSDNRKFAAICEFEISRICWMTKSLWTLGINTKKLLSHTHNFTTRRCVALQKETPQQLAANHWTQPRLFLPTQSKPSHEI